jgi:hypothetical protein
MASEQNNRGAFLIQQHYCDANAAPIYGRMCAAVAAGLTRDTAMGARILDWPGEPTRDALPLRFFGGLHALVQAGRDDGLAAVFAGRVTEQAEIIATLERVLAEHEAALLPWLDGPPQTNEPGRSAALLLGLIEIARRHGPRIELLEIGSSAGLNLLIDRYRFDLGGTFYGPADSPSWPRKSPSISTNGASAARSPPCSTGIAPARLSSRQWTKRPSARPFSTRRFPRSSSRRWWCGASRTPPSYQASSKVSTRSSPT